MPQLSDPIGPGSPAWEASQDAIDLWTPNAYPGTPEAKNNQRAGCALSRMITHLKAAGQAPEIINAWKLFVHTERH